MSIVVDALQELPAEEEVGLAAGACCWRSATLTCGTLSLTLTITTCHSCTNTA
jgi:hypothetical protein